MKAKPKSTPARGSQGAASPNRQTTPFNVQSKNIAATATQQQLLQWPQTNPTGKPYPDMPKVGDKEALLQSMGASGTAIFSGIITSEEYNPDFYWKDGIRIFEQMLRNDGQINAMRMMVELPLRRATWSIEPFSDSAKDKEIASFLESCLFHDMSYTTSEGRVLTQKWDDILRHILMMLWYGFMCFEVNWKIEDGWTKWARWTPLLPRTIWRWWVGGDNELVGVQQWTFKDYSYEFVDIPAEKLLVFVHRQEGNNFEGVSLLRSAYKHWFYKVQFEKIEAIGIERNAIVPPVVHLPENFTANDITIAQMIGQNMRSNEMGAVTLPPGMDVEYPKNMQRYAMQVQPSIQYHDVMIARNVLAQFLNLGSSETGSYALADTQVQTFLNSMQAVAEQIEDVINSDAVKRLVDYNYDDVEGYPRVKCSKLQGDLNVIGTVLKDMASMANPLITPDPETEDWIRDLLGMPKASRSPVTATNPTAPANAARPDSDPGHTQAQPQDKPGVPSDSAPLTAAEDLAQQVMLLNESLYALDAVGRGQEHMMLYNMNHGKGGRFDFGKGGGDYKGGSGAGTHKAEAGHMAKRSEGEAGKSRMGKQGKATVARIAKQRGEAKSGGAASASHGKGESVHEKSASTRSKSTEARVAKLEAQHQELMAAHKALMAQSKAQAKELARVKAENARLKAKGAKPAKAANKPSTHETGEGLTPRANAPTGTRVNVYAHPNASQLHQIYGSHQLAKALRMYTHVKLRQTAHDVGVKPGKTIGETAQRIADKVIAQEGTIE